MKDRGLLLFLTLFVTGYNAQGINLMSFLDPQKINQMMQLATDLTSAAAHGVTTNERESIDRATQVDAYDPNAPPSTMLAQGLQNMLNPARRNLLNALTGQVPTEPPTTTPSTTTTATTTTTTAITFPTFPTFTFAPLPNIFTTPKPLFPHFGLSNPLKQVVKQSPPNPLKRPPQPPKPRQGTMGGKVIPARPRLPGKRHPIKKPVTTTAKPEYDEDYDKNEEEDDDDYGTPPTRPPPRRPAARKAKQAPPRPLPTRPTTTTPPTTVAPESLPRTPRIPIPESPPQIDSPPQTQTSAVEENPLLRLAQSFIRGATGSSQSTGTDIHPTFKSPPSEVRQAPVSMPSNSNLNMENIQQLAKMFMGGSSGRSSDQFSPASPSSTGYQQRAAPTVSESNGNANMQQLQALAQAFLGGGNRNSVAPASSASASAAAAPQTFESAGNGGNQQQAGLQLPTIRDFLPGAGNNFGIKKGEGCLPFLSEFMQAAYGNCQRDADQKAFDTWGSEIKNAILEGRMDLLGASKETCKRTAERQSCAKLRQVISDCDIMQSIQIGTQLQREMKRCEELTGIIDQNPMAILGQVNNLLTGEVAQGFFSNFMRG